MPPTALDTSVVIAGLLVWHEAHTRSSKALEETLGSALPTVLPVHTLLEAYSVLTRLPLPRRLSPQAARTVLGDSLREATVVAGWDGDTIWPTVESFAEHAIIGGQVYDAFILTCAKKAGATRLLTLNGRHFRRLADENMEIVEP